MKIVLAEDDLVHRSFLKDAVDRAVPECDQIIEVDDGAGVLELLKHDKIEFIIMDLQMPGVSGVDAAREVWRMQPNTRILFWSNYADEAYVRGVARIVPENAVYGYLLKSASEERLELAVRGVFIEDQNIIDREVRGVQQRSNNRFDALTDYEYEALLDISIGLTDKTIAARRHLSTRSVQNRLGHLYEKLGIEPQERAGGSGPVYNTRTRAVAIAFSRGLLNLDALTKHEFECRRWIKQSEKRSDNGQSP